MTTIPVRITGIQEGSIFLAQFEHAVSTDIMFRGRGVSGTATYAHPEPNPCPFAYGAEYSVIVSETGCVLQSGEGVHRARVNELQFR